MKLLTALFLFVASCASAQVRITYEGDTLRGNVRRMTEYRYSRYDSQLEVKSVYTCDPTARIEMASFSGGNDDLSGGRWVAKFDANGQIIETGLYCKDDTPCQVYTHKYDAQGREIEGCLIDHLNHLCNSLSDWLGGMISNWVVGEYTAVNIARNEYDQQGRLRMKKNEHFDLLPDTDTTTETTTYTYYGITDRVANMKKVTLDIGPRSRSSRTELTNYNYDFSGNKVEETFLKIGPSDEDRDSATTLCRYDARNNLIEAKTYYTAAWNRNSKTPSGKRIGGGTVYSYDSLDKRITTTSYEIFRKDDGQETKSWSETRNIEHRKEDDKVYDNYGNIVEQTHNGVRILNREIEYF